MVDKNINSVIYSVQPLNQILKINSASMERQNHLMHKI